MIHFHITHNTKIGVPLAKCGIRHNGSAHSLMRLSHLLLLIFLAVIAGASAQNVAQGKPVTASAGTWSGLPPGNAADGNVGTFTHPDTGAQTGFYYQVDLGAEYAPHHLSVIN